MCRLRPRGWQYAGIGRRHHRQEEEDGNDDPRHPDGRLPLGEANNNGRYEAAARELLTGQRLTDIYVKLISLTFKFMPP
jgi:hypothetical protein